MVETPWQYPKRILVFGDSNSWGYVAAVGKGAPTRLNDALRWPGILQSELGDEITVLVDALCGRLSDVDAGPAPPDEGPDVEPSMFNGLRHAVVAGASQSPLHLVIVMLGTNDVGAAPARDASAIAAGVAKVAQALVQGAGVFVPGVRPRVLLVAPPPLGGPREPADAPAFWAAAWEKSRQLAPAIAQVAFQAGFDFFDAGGAIATDGADHVHLTEVNHATLGLALVPIVRQLCKA